MRFDARCGFFVVFFLAAAVVTSGQTLYFSQDDNSSGLYTLDTTTGAATSVGASGVTSSTVGLAPGHLPGILLGSTWSDIAHIQDDGSGVVVLSGSVGAEGLAYDAVNDIFYGAINGNFFTIDPDTGLQIASLAGPGADIEGLAVDPATGLVYGTGNTTNLLVYNPGTASWSTVGDTGINWYLGGLAFDPGSNVLYVCGTNSGDNLYRLDPSTAAATLIGPTGLSPTEGGLAFTGGQLFIPAIPDLGLSGIIVLVALLSIIGVLVIRR